MEAAARERGGRCLSTRYANMSAKLRWQCKEGHEWETTPFSVIINKTWCPSCARQARHKGVTIEYFHELAAARGGECLNWAYRNANVPLQWRCAKGHVWSASASHVKRGSWCPICAKSSKKPSHTIEEMRALAAKRGGECLSARYDPYQVLTWRCSRGHEWQAKGSAILRGHWCQACAAEAQKGKPRKDTRHLNIEAARAIAKERGGKCLSEEYVGGLGKMRWQCAEGHAWDARFQEIRRGTWCPLCARPRQGCREDEIPKEIAIRVSRPYTTGGKPARYLFARRVAPGDEAGARLVVNSIVMQVDSGEIPPLGAGKGVLEAYMAGSTSAISLVEAEYRGCLTALASIHVPSGNPCGWLVLSRAVAGDPAVAVDIYLDPRFQERGFVAPIWHHVQEMAAAWLPTSDAGGKKTTFTLGRLVPGKIAAILSTPRSIAARAPMERAA